MGNPIKQLMQDHELIEKKLDDALLLSEELLKDGKVSLDKWDAFIQFVRQFADGAHHKKEEDYLFPALYKVGLPQGTGPIACMLHEHEAGRDYIRQLEEGLQLWETDKVLAKEKIIRNACGYVELLRAHIRKENQVLFKMADRLLSPLDKESLWKAFNAINGNPI